MADDLITTRAAAGLLGVGTTSIKRWADDGTLACVRTAGGHRRFLRGDVLRLLRRGQTAEAAPTQGVANDSRLLERLPSMSRAQLDALPFGAIKLSDAGAVLEYNAAEEEFAGVRRATVLGRPFFTEVAPCTNNRLIRGRFKEGIRTGVLDLRIDYTFTMKMAPRLVQLHLFRDVPTGTNWLLIHPR